MIHNPQPNEFVISASQVWLKGVYDSKRTANYAFRLTDDEKGELSAAHDYEKGMISYEEIKEKIKNRKK